MKYLLLAVLQIAFLLTASSAALGQQQLISDPEIYEKEHFQKRCNAVKFGPDFITRLDINNDGIIDAVVNEGEIVCDGMRGPDCTDDGCPYNFYLQVKEGGYFMIATAKMYGYDFIKRFGNMVFVMQMHPRYCERTDEAICEITVRVRGTKFLTISKK
ncbi:MULTISPECIES: hypothetical protein [Alphaproteobacteria]|uniref:Uncharacterized protein n=2 Tax=Alphaproteobacteria TaxID=28211 RepID=A0A512HIU7_9HYPH|nr:MULTISPECIES: hypothetical protein [Alphaproteobacteria]GEO85320.1 hypothetical protein RNA01_22520 [Ciceribacter naphthalenivorans]GLR20959.1 hypothetical protein GCM10007920_07440 [Ciceribacter naphthalenivorans]GLT03815.1 hypothetical protein GCM10007926_07440 [Sphingomonas psychrolutea]